MKNAIRSRAALAIIFMVFSVLSFALPFHKNGVFWLSYIFAAVAIALQLYALKIAFEKETSVKSKFYGFPIANISVLYMLAQLVLSLVFMALSAVAPLWLALILYVILLGAASIGFIAADAMRDEIERQDEQLKKDVGVMRELQSRINGIASQSQDTETTAQLQKLSEAFRFSDPVSSDATAELEKEIGVYLSELQQATIDEDKLGVSSLCSKVQALLNERNRICKLNK